ncbi:hypothetical protein, partial [Aeromonas salmonicida]|uniref:hypothetical protein n=1 Tax=Aeromonas salmonicida TaxID=645 RepID=UPI0031CDCBE5
RGMVVLRSLGFQLVPFKLHRFRKQRHAHHSAYPAGGSALRRMTIVKEGHLRVPFSAVLH